eukprot:712049-Pelagomonas_calceolata.AAC.9
MPCTRPSVLAFLCVVLEKLLYICSLTYPPGSAPAAYIKDSWHKPLPTMPTSRQTLCTACVLCLCTVPVGRPYVILCSSHQDSGWGSENGAGNVVSIGSASDEGHVLLIRLTWAFIDLIS